MIYHLSHFRCRKSTRKRLHFLDLQKQCFWTSSWSSPIGCLATVQLPLDHIAPIHCLVHGLAPSLAQCVPASANALCESTALKQPLCTLPLMLLNRHRTSAPYPCPRHPLCASVCHNRWRTQWASLCGDTERARSVPAEEGTVAAP